MEIHPSLISSNLLNLERTIKVLEPYCEGYHLDVMDYHFAPNLTWGPMFINAFIDSTNKPFFIHLMVNHPLVWIEPMSLRPQDFFVFHYEAFSSYGNQNIYAINKCISLLKEKGCKLGIAINPNTEIEVVFPFLAVVDTVLVMSVYPGFSGQTFIPDVVDKIPLLVEERKRIDASFKIAMDGGINMQNIAELHKAGVEQFGIASAIFNNADLVIAIQELRIQAQGI